MAKRVVVVFFCLLTSPLCAEDNLQFRLQGDITMAPWFYEPTYQMHSVNLGTSWLFGLKINHFTIGLETFVDYYTLDSQESTAAFDGAWFNIRSVFNSYFKLNEWLELKVGAGGIWFRSAFIYNDSEVLAQNLGGLSFLLNMYILLPWSFLDLEIRNTCDLLFVTDWNTNFMGLAPNYFGGLRVNFHPGIPWLSVFLELNGVFWRHRSEINDFSTGMFKVNAGVALHTAPAKRSDTRKERGQPEVHLKVTKTEKLGEKQTQLTKTEIQAEPKLPENKPMEKIEEIKVVLPPKELDLNEKNLTEISKSTAGAQFTFTNITFLPASSQLDSKAQTALDKLAIILQENPNLHFAVSGYTDLMGDPRQELELSVSRANAVRNYLITQGVEPDRVRLIQVGQLNSTKVIFSLIKS